jgi:hypothetical protein
MIGYFSEGLASFRNAKSFCGFIDKTGKLVIETPFVYVRCFAEGLAVAKTREKGFYGQPETKWGVIDKTGRIIFEENFDELYSFSEGIAVAEKADEIFFVDKSGNIITSINKNEFFFDVNGTKRFSEGLIAVYDKKIGKAGFMDKTGKVVIEPKFESAANFSEGLARVSVKVNHREYLGFINPEGEYVIEPKFDIDSDFLRCTNDFSEGLASLIDGPPMMDKDSTFMFIDKTGETVLRTEFFRAECFHSGLAVVWDEHKNKYGYIDKSGKLAIPLRYICAFDFSEGLARISF